MESSSIRKLLPYPFVLRCSRFSWARNCEGSPSFRFTAPPLPTWRRFALAAGYIPGKGPSSILPPPAARGPALAQ